ncbi:hypothetical protein Pla123a_16710 [Posidoniimonas polymericola]|uniref:Uncharacterized protein n=1 Tax=Posidoniimonas polymericola TaxID=2528002 RepID=A0A5C5YT10_9BACT|nr:hypothetical protein [Posidoniimonas polymericola]TWT77873.1 hypothetical protein Pla123a_16710 [Posidoniimonas polymericola]
MTTLRMQPTFQVAIDGTYDDAVQRLRAATVGGVLGAHTDAAGSCLDLRVGPSERRPWSPHLGAQLTPVGDGVVLFARFSPRPEIWTFVMMLYFAAACLACGGAVYGWVQYTLGETPWGLIGVPVGLAAIAVLHIVGVVGQRLSSDQMHDLRERLDRVVAEVFKSP